MKILKKIKNAVSATPTQAATDWLKCFYIVRLKFSKDICGTGMGLKSTACDANNKLPRLMQAALTPKLLCPVHSSTILWAQLIPP